jgi:hypothetical protein
MESIQNLQLFAYLESTVGLLRPIGFGEMQYCIMTQSDEIYYTLCEKKSDTLSVAL